MQETIRRNPVQSRKDQAIERRVCPRNDAVLRRPVTGRYVSPYGFVCQLRPAFRIACNRQTSLPHAQQLEPLKVCRLHHGTDAIPAS